VEVEQQLHHMSGLISQLGQTQAAAVDDQDIGTDATL